ncbi:dihydrodiol dehydrogenase [Nocardia sp. NPDC052278]|uniref:dihydrodiol dehydrogenase n=1 Tax=unclassified Nocardia TaxID=2637762 RepID=UPI0036921255
MNPLRLSNEFAEVTMRVVATGNGERLEITSLRRGTNIRLDPVVLEALTWQTADVFTRMLEGSIGPTTL